MERVIQAILDSIEEQEKTVIRICGHGASGKTTLAKRLYQVLPKDSTYLLETDAYIISNSSGVQVTYDLKGVEGCYQMPACHPARHELASLKRDILMFRKGMDLLTIDTSWSPSQIISGQGKLLIVEGMSSTFLEKELFDLSIFAIQIMRLNCRDVCNEILVNVDAKLILSCRAINTEDVNTNST